MLKTRLTDEELFIKYANGAIPPLVHPSDSRLGLIDYDLLEIYQRGFGGVHNVPLGVLLAKGSGQTASEDKWRGGDFCYNERAKVDWTHLCRLIRANAQANIACEECDRNYAMLAEKAGQAMAYLAPDGLIDFVVPVKVKAQTVAVLWSGQLLPAEGTVWPLGLVQAKAGAETAVEDRINLRAHSNALLQRFNALGIGQADIEQAIAKDFQVNRGTVKPDLVKRMLNTLDTAATHLSNLATNTLELEKFRLTSIIELEFSRTLATLKQDLSNWSEAFDALRHSLKRFIDYLGLEFAAICRLRTPAQLELIAHVGFDESILPKGTLLLNVNQMHPSEEHWRKPQMRIIQLADDASCAVFKGISKRASDTGSPRLDLLMVTPDETPKFALLLGNAATSKFAAVSDTDAESVLRIASFAGLSCETLFLLKDLRDSQKAMDRFLEDVAHDIRSPIQNVITKAALLKRIPVDEREYVRQASRIAAAVMRINLIARRVWTVQRLGKEALLFVTALYGYERL